MRDKHAMHVTNNILQWMQELHIVGIVPSAIQQQ